MSHQYLDGRETVTWSNLVEGTTTHFGTADDNAIIGLPGKCRLHAVVVSAASADQAAGVMDVRVRADSTASAASQNVATNITDTGINDDTVYRHVFEDNEEVPDGQLVEFIASTAFTANFRCQIAVEYERLG